MTKKGEQSQIDKFREAARELETDDSEERFDAILAKIVKAPKRSAEQVKAAAKSGSSKPKD